MNRILLSALTLVLLAGCASERIVLLPSPDGKPSAVVVQDRNGVERVLDQPYAATARRLGANRVYQDDADEVRLRYATTLQAEPLRPVSFVLYFEVASDRLTPESEVEFARVKQEVASRSAPEVMVIGHTDRVGSTADNDALSRQRAETVRDLLVADGLPAEKLEVAGRGEREPLVETADEVEEARNRRVEINIR
jgi:outer membrane protein OmpA-like peptidoglycan-associated protein